MSRHSSLPAPSGLFRGMNAGVPMPCRSPLVRCVATAACRGCRTLPWMPVRVGRRTGGIHRRICSLLRTATSKSSAWVSSLAPNDHRGLDALRRRSCPSRAQSTTSVSPNAPSMTFAASSRGAVYRAVREGDRVADSDDRFRNCDARGAPGCARLVARWKARTVSWRLSP